jgi:ribosomal protein L12E/L44/L45/RPP1/RPP2
MKYIAAYLLAVLGGNDAPTAADVGAILKSADIEVDDAAVDAVLKAVDGKDLNTVLTDGTKKLVKIGGGGGGGAAPAAGAAAAAVVEEEEEEEEEESAGGAGGMFGGSEASSS